MEQTIKEKAIDVLANKISENLNQVDFMKNEIQRLSLLSNDLHDAMMIVHGLKGYYYCRCSNDMPQSGFTEFSEVVSTVGNPMVRVSLEPIEETPGFCVFIIDERGMMTAKERMA